MNFIFWVIVYTALTKSECPLGVHEKGASEKQKYKPQKPKPKTKKNKKHIFFTTRHGKRLSNL